MVEVNLPSLEYRRYLSDAASGLIALISLGIIIFIGNNEAINNFYYNIYNNSSIKIDWTNVIIVLIVIILFISPLVGFIINCLSYALFNDLIEEIANLKRFQTLLKILGTRNYYIIYENYSKYCNEIFSHFDINNLHNMRGNKGCGKCIGEIEYLLGIENPETIKGAEAIRGGYVMFRNLLFITTFSLLLIFLRFIKMDIQMIFLLLFIILFSSRYYLRWKGKFLSHVYIPTFLSLILIPISIKFLPFDVLSNPSWLGFPFGYILIFIFIVVELVLLSISSLTLVYTNYYIFFAALYVALGEKWNKKH